MLTGADIGSTIRSEVTASNAAGSATAHSVPTGTVDPVAPVNTVAPALSGVARDGQTLSASTGTWTGTDPIAYTYQWQRCDAGGGNCADIAGETGSSYDLAGADIGHSVRVQVTATNVAGHATASSSPTTAVIPDPPANTVAPALSGTAQDGSTLTLDDGTWSGTDPLAFDIVWQRCDAAGANCVAIPGETGTSYTLTADDIDSTIRALVTASNVAGIAAAQTAPTTVVAPEPPANTVAPVVSGTRVDGETLSTNDGTWSGTQPILFTYQWQRCDAARQHLRKRPGRDWLELHAGGRRHRPRRPRGRHRRQRRRRRLGLLRGRRPGRARAARQRRRADRHRHPARRPDADRARRRRGTARSR